MENDWKELEELIRKVSATILYKCTQDEVDCLSQQFPFSIHSNQITLPNSRESDSLMWAEKCIAEFKAERVVIFIPGREFDIYGTRKGHGGGWYDRFLSKIPEEWLRVGVANAKQISSDKLPRNDWDEPVHWILSKHKEGWKAHKIIV